VKQAGGTADGAAPARGITSQHHERHLERLIDRLPERLQKIIRWLRRPGLHWVRLVAGVLFIAGSFLSILPIFGIWMLPVGLVLLAEDIPPLRRVRGWFLGWVEQQRAHWVGGPGGRSRTQGVPPWSLSNAGGGRSNRKCYVG